MVIIGSLGTQAAAVMVTDMLATVGALGVSDLRMAAAAVIMVALFRPKLAGMTRARAINIVVYGVVTGMMSMMVYAAIARLPQGVAVTIDFLAPASCPSSVAQCGAAPKNRAGRKQLKTTPNNYVHLRKCADLTRFAGELFA